MRVLAMLLVGAVALGAGGAIAAEGKRWTGKKITIDVQDADIGNVLRLIADVSGKNVVFGEEVKGKVTIKLKNVPWDQALDVILKTKDYGLVEDGNILMIAPQAELDAAEMRELNMAAEAELKGPLYTRLVPVSYATAKEMAEKVRPLLTKRGTVTVDERTNTLIIRDVRGSQALRL